MNLLELLLPALIIVLISLPLVNVFKGKTSLKQARTRLAAHTSMFFAVLCAFVLFEINGFHVFAEGDVNAVNSIVGTAAQGMGFLAAALATGMSKIETLPKGLNAKDNKAKAKPTRLKDCFSI